MSIFKYLKLAVMFKDVVTAYKEETGKDKAPAILHRRVYGGILMIIGVGLGIYYGVDLTSTVEQIVTNLETIISAVVAIYGAVGVIVGIIKSKRKSDNTDNDKSLTLDNIW